MSDSFSVCGQKTLHAKMYRVSDLKMSAGEWEVCVCVNPYVIWEGEEEYYNCDGL